MAEVSKERQREPSTYPRLDAALLHNAGLVQVDAEGKRDMVQSEWTVFSRSQWRLEQTRNL